MMVDADARYLKSHEWVKKDEGNVFSVGLSAYALEQLGDIVYIELPAVGQELLICTRPFPERLFRSMMTSPTTPICSAKMPMALAG
jgi:hypothetical protein